MTFDRLAAVGAAWLTVASPSVAHAHWSASSGRSLLVERYLVCDEDLDVRCVGPVAAKHELLAALRVDAIATDRNNDRIVDPAHEAAIFAAYFEMRDATRPLRRLLVLPMPRDARDTHAEMEVLGLRAEAAYALAALGDDQSAPDIAKLVRGLETDGYGFLWRDTLEALTRLSPTVASAYARDFLGRYQLADMRTSLPGGSSHLEVLAPILAAHDRKALGILRELTADEDATDQARRAVKTNGSGRGRDLDHGAAKLPLGDAHHWCQLTATRLALGDEPLRADVRKAFAGSYGGTMVATCDNAFLRTFGSDPADVGILVRHLGRDDLGFDAGMSLVAYDRIIALIATLDARERESGASTAITDARKRLREGLRERSSYPHVADPDHRNFGTHFVALHSAALAGLGDTSARKRLHAMVVDERDRSGVGDLAAIQALRLDVLGAVDDAARRLAIDVAFANDERSGIFSDVRIRLLDELRERAPADPRWTVALVDAEANVRERAIHWVARTAPRGTCDVVLGGAEAASERAVDDGLLVLTTIPGGCERELRARAEDADQTAAIRGMSIEALAILGAKLPRKLVRDAAAQQGLAIHLDRAAAIEAILPAR